MGLGEMLRKLRRSQGPEGYSQYKHERDHAREQEERARDDKKKAADLERETAEREHRYADRYAREHEGDTARSDQKDIEPDR